MIRIDPLLAYTVAVLVGVTSLLLLGTVASWLVRRRSVPLRHGIAVTTLVLALATPWLIAFGGRIPGIEGVAAPIGSILPVGMHSGAPVTASSSPRRDLARQDATPLAEDPLELHEGSIATARRDVDVRREAAASHDPSDGPALMASNAPTIPRELGWAIAILWSVGCGWRCLRFARGVVAITRLRARLGIARASTRRLASDISVRMKMRRVPAVRTSPDVPVPLSTGIVSPVVVVPQDVEASADPDTLRDLLVHETAHVAHRDTLIGMLQRIADILFWFHPLLPRLQRGIERLREERCDTWVLRFQSSPRIYAATLLRLAERTIRPPAFPATVGLLSGRGSFETRVASLLQEDRDMTTTLHPFGRTALVGTAAIAIIGIASLGLTHTTPPVHDAGPAEPPAGNRVDAEAEVDDGFVRGNLVSDDFLPPGPVGPTSSISHARIEAAIASGAAWLVEHQRPDGSWLEPDSYFGGDIGTTALAARALLHANPTDTNLAIAASTAVSRAVRWLLAQQGNPLNRHAGFFGTGREAGFFYGHVLATLLLADAYRITKDESLHEPLEHAVKATLEAQNPYKGWRYGIRTGDNDTSATGCALLALDAARRAGIKVPEQNIRHGLAWLDEVTESSTGLVGFTGLGYYDTRLPGRNDDYIEHPTLTAIAAIARDLHDRAKYRRAIGLALSHLLADLPRDEGTTPNDGEVTAPIEPLDPETADLEDPRRSPRPKNGLTRDYYYWHWGTAAMYRANGPSGEAWQSWSEPAFATILAAQIRDGAERGSWPAEARWAVAAGPEYATAINLLTLRTATIVPLPR